MSDDGNTELDGVPPCDECNSEFGALWCEKCGHVLCQECGAQGGKHDGHPVGTIGTSDDPYEFNAEDDDDRERHAGAAQYDAAADEAAAMGLISDSGAGQHQQQQRAKPRGVIEEYITEDEAYHVLEMMESNAHISCRKLFKPLARDALRAMLRERHTPEPTSTAEWTATGEAVRLTPEQWASFANASYLVLDNFVDPSTALAARDQTLSMVQQGLLTEYRNPKDVGRDNSARSDLRLFIHGGHPMVSEGPLSHLVERLEQLRAALDEGIALTGEQHEYQLAYYGSRGEHYQRHRDAFPNDGSRRMTGQVGRRVTCTLYMNDYAEANGGKLRIYVPDAGFNGETPVDIAPVAGRAVLFLSGAMDHEVLPSFAPRCAIAAWYS